MGDPPAAADQRHTSLGLKFFQVGQAGAAAQITKESITASMRIAPGIPYLAVLGIPNALHQHFEEGPGRLGVVHDKGAEVPFGEHQAVQLRLSGDLRRTVGVIDECHLPEVVTGAEGANRPPVTLTAVCPSTMTPKLAPALSTSVTTVPGGHLVQSASRISVGGNPAG